LLQKLFVVPSFTPFQAKIPYGRVNHNKYMVTDKVAYIGEGRSEFLRLSVSRV